MGSPAVTITNERSQQITTAGVDEDHNGECEGDFTFTTRTEGVEMLFKSWLVDKLNAGQPKSQTKKILDRIARTFIGLMEPPLTATKSEREDQDVRDLVNRTVVDGCLRFGFERGWTARATEGATQVVVDTHVWFIGDKQKLSPNEVLVFFKMKLLALNDKVKLGETEITHFGDYFFTTYMQHIRLFRHVFSTPQERDVREVQVAIETVTSPPPLWALNEGITLQKWEEMEEMRKREEEAAAREAELTAKSAEEAAEAERLRQEQLGDVGETQPQTDQKMNDAAQKTSDAAEPNLIQLKPYPVERPSPEKILPNFDLTGSPNQPTPPPPAVESAILEHRRNSRSQTSRPSSAASKRLAQARIASITECILATQSHPSTTTTTTEETVEPETNDVPCTIDAASLASEIQGVGFAELLVHFERAVEFETEQVERIGKAIVERRERERRGSMGGGAAGGGVKSAGKKGSAKPGKDGSARPVSKGKAK
ncbi:hypothetical protein BJ742DRAFT_849856 [Cladochytrium replicatum]|nr:hypothetical protein BJ742DRAFT_849856 [Cladochytrium replicatum]